MIFLYIFLQLFAKKNEAEKKIIANKIEALMPNLLSLRNNLEFSGAAAGLVHIFLNNLGIVMKSEVIEQFKSIDNDIKAKLRNSGIRFG